MTRWELALRSLGLLIMARIKKGKQEKPPEPPKPVPDRKNGTPVFIRTSSSSGFWTRQ